MEGDCLGHRGAASSEQLNSARILPDTWELLAAASLHGLDIAEQPLRFKPHGQARSMCGCSYARDSAVKLLIIPFGPEHLESRCAQGLNSPSQAWLSPSSVNVTAQRLPRLQINACQSLSVLTVQRQEHTAQDSREHFKSTPAATE